MYATSDIKLRGISTNDIATQPDSQGASAIACDAAEHLPRGLFVVDDDLRVLYANALARDFLRAAYHLPLERHPDFLNEIPAADAQPWRHSAHQAFSGKTVKRDLSRQTAEGAEQVLRIEARSLETGLPGKRRVLILFDDATAERKVEREWLDMHDALREATRTRDTIFSILGHDLRSPIAQLNAVLYFLRHAPERLNEDKIATYVADLEESTRLLSRALDNLLHWSSVHRDTISPQFEEVDVAALAAEAASMLALDAKRKEIEIVSKATEDLRIRTDKGLLAYIMRNLLANAIKFSSPRGRVQLLQDSTVEGAYRLQLIDCGIGMDPEHLLAVRDREKLVSTSGTSGEKGLGLGLSLCREFCDLLNGALSIDSSPGKGTCVTVILPAESSQ